MSRLFEEYHLNEGQVLRNRLVMAPMATASAQPDGQVSIDELDYYRHRSVDVGMVITGASYVVPNGMGYKNQFYSGDDLYLPSLSRIAQSIHFGDAKGILQLSHAGRLSRSCLIGGNQVECPSAVKAEKLKAEVPRALGESEIYNILDGFYNATVRAINAGFDGVEIHGSDGCLIHQFFSPHSNQREDYWGGDVESRMRFPIAVISSVKRAAADCGARNFIIGYRLTPEETEVPGIRLSDTLKYAAVLPELALSYLSLSLDSYNQRSKVNSKERLPVGKQIIKAVKGKIPVIGGGAVRNIKDAEGALEMGYDLVQLGRTMVLNPDWVKTSEADMPIRTGLNGEDHKNLYIPKGMISRLENEDGWFG